MRKANDGKVGVLLSLEATVELVRRSAMHLFIRKIRNAISLVKLA